MKSHNELPMLPKCGAGWAFCLFLATHALIASCASVPVKHAAAKLEDYAGTYQNVPTQASLDALRAAFAAAGNHDAQVIVLPWADHACFVRDVAGNVTYAAGYFSRMAEWLKDEPAPR
jgi:hypothetical protein